MKTQNEVMYDARDKLAEISSILLLADDSLGSIEHQGDDVKVQGISAILWNIKTQLDAIENDFTKSLKR